MNDRARTLAARISEIFEAGLDVPAEVVGFIESTLADPSPEGVAAFLHDPEDSEADTLAELIFFPDEAVQMALEDHLTAAGFTPADQPAIAAALGDRSRSVRLRFPGGGTPVTVPLSPSSAEAFVARLHIDCHPDDRISEAIAGVGASADGPRYRVRLRNSRLAWTPPRVDFLRQFFEAFGSDPADALPLLDRVLGWLSEIAPDRPVIDGLAEKKREARRVLELAEGFERKRRAGNIETLAMQGIRIPHIDTAAIFASIAAIDRITLGIHGTIIPDDPAPVRMDVDAGEAAVRRMVERLS